MRSRRTRQRLLLAASLLAVAVAAPRQLAAEPRRAPAEEGAQPPVAPPAGAIAIDVPLQLNGFYLGDISIRTTRAGEFISLDGERFATLLQTRVNEETLKAIRAALAASGDRFVGIEPFKQDGFDVAFDPGELRVAVTVSAARAPVQELSLSGSSAATGDLLPLAGFSGALNISLAQNWINESRNDPSREGWEPLTGAIDGYFNIGGINGVYLFHQWIYDSGSDTKFTRGPAVLVHDLINRGIRIAVGDVSPFGTELQGAAELGGFQIATAYAQIQPNRNIRPAGRTQFVLERTSRVEVEVNGIIVRTLTLTPGQYDLRDLSYSEGLNDVRLFVEDSAGRRELGSFSGFFANSLLEPGINDFSIAAGFQREAVPGGFRYLTDRPQFTGFFRRGLGPNFTGGVNAQLADDLINFGAEGVLATRLGTFVGQGSASHSQGQSGFATSMGFRHTGAIAGYASEVEVLWDYRSDHYRALNEFQLRNDVSHEVSARWRQLLPFNIAATVGASYLQRRSGPDSPRYTVSVGRPFGRLVANVLVEGGRNFRGEEEHNVLVSLTYRLGQRSTLRGQYRSRLNEKLIEFDRQAYNGIGEWGVRAGIVDANDRRLIEGQADLYTNRGELGVRTGRVEDFFSGDRSVETTFRAAVGVGFADGHFAFGRPVYDGFAIVRPHKTLNNSRITVGGGSRPGERPIATTDIFGPALVPLQRPYQVQSLDVAVQNAPVGYDLGGSRFSVLPGARSGVDVVVGSDASNTVIGTLVASDGEPVALRSGVLRSVERPDEEPLPLFTNRTGRFAASGVRPGTYRIVIDDLDTGQTLKVPAESTGLVQAGRVTVEKK
jgi:outer membrane usher protein